MRRGTLAALLLGVGSSFAAGCSLGTEESLSGESSRNQCSEGDSCGAGFCKGGICQTSQAPLGALLLSVVPPAGTASIAGVNFTQTVTEFQVGTNGYDVVLGSVSRVRGRVTGADIAAENCVSDAARTEAAKAADSSLPARLTLIPRSRVLGVSNASHSIEVDDGGDSNLLTLNVPPGTYDLYVEPVGLSDGCVRPPYLALNQELPSETVNLNVLLPSPEQLTVRVLYPGSSNDLEGWQVDIVERQTGRLLSNKATLQGGQASDAGWEYITQVAFSQVEGDDAAPATELVRLRPPDDVVGPTIYVERSVVDLFQGGQGLIDQLSSLAKSVTFQGRVATDDARAPVLASVRLIATSLDGTGPGTVAAFSRLVETDEDGLFEAELLPGTYRVIAEPWDETLATQEIDVTVTDAETQAGKTLEVVPRAEVRGVLADFFGASVVGFPVNADSLGLETSANVLELARGLQKVTPLATSTLSASDGRFVMRADPGTYFLSAEPQSSSGYAWRIVLGVDIAQESLDLGKIRLPLPVAVPGTLRSEDLGDVVPNASITAYAYLKAGEIVDDPAEANQVIPIAETRSDESGTFRLLLPSSFK